MDTHSSLYDCFNESIFHETRKNEFMKLFAETETDKDRIATVLKLPSAKNLSILENFEGKSSLRSDGLLEEAVSRETMTSLHTLAILTAPESSTSMASGYLARAEAYLSNGDPHSAQADAKRALELQELLEPEDVFSAYQTLGCALCITKQWETAEKVLDQALQKLRVTEMDNAAKASAVGKIVPLLKKAKTESKNSREIFGDGIITSDVNCDSSPRLPDISYGVNTSIPAASTAANYAYSQEKGRHLVATRDIKIGDVVIVEEPFAWSTQNVAALKTHCLHCLRRVKAPIPCKNCSTVCYCGRKCKEDSWESYHKYECKILGHFYDSSELSGMALLAYRVIATAGIPAITSVYEPRGSPTSSSPFRTRDYSSVYWQESHSNERLTDDLLKRAITSVFLLRCLQKGGFLCYSLPHADVPTEEELLVGTALLRHLQSCSCNAYEVTETLVGGGRGVRHAEPFEIGGAVYPTISLLNHGCNANLARHSINGKFCVIRASRNIRKGEELLDNYGVYFVTTPLAERINLLERQYFFRCSCVACTEDWKTFDKLELTHYKCVECDYDLGSSLSSIKSCPKCRKGDYQKFRKRLQQLTKAYSEALQKLLEGQVEECLLRVQKYFEEVEKYVVEPCKELIKCQQVMNQCWSLLGNKDESDFSNF